MREQLWNCWNLVHGFPTAEYTDGDTTAVVHYGGLTRTLEADFRPDRLPKSLPDRLLVGGFAGRFPKGKKVWDATIVFAREQGSTVWDFYEVWLFGSPPANEPADIIGFLADYPARDRGVWGTSRDWVADRARAGRPNGPKNAAEVGHFWGKRPHPLDTTS